MNRNFTNQDAKQLSEKHNSLLNRLRAPEKAAETERKLAGLVFAKLQRSGELEVWASEELAGRSGKINSDIQDLIVQLFRCKQFEIANNACKKVLEKYKNDIEENLAALKPATGALRWIFSSFDNQNAAIQAYEKLMAMLSSEYVNAVNEATRMIELTNSSSLTPSFDEAYNDLRTNLKFYRSLFYSVVSGSAQLEQKPIRVLAATLQKQDEIDKLSTNLSDKIEEKKSLVKKAADLCAAKEALRILEEVPVEEVNHQGAGGIRVKVLHDYGYDTMADLYAASVYQLASIRGISEDSAFQMKRIVDRFLKTSQSEARIRLNADDRNKESTGLVKALCSYRNIKDCIDKVDSLNLEYGDKVKKAAGILHRIGNGTEWLFFRDDEKIYASSSLKYLQAVHSGKYESAIKEATQAINNQVIYTADQAWADFRESPIIYYNILETIIPGILGSGDSYYGLPEELAIAIQEESFFPDGLLCTLRPYQELGVKYTLHQEKVLLGDEMGLGKTIQAIATMVSLRNTGATHFLVICPASVLSNWCREVRKHSKLKVTKIHGAGRNLAIQSWLKTGGVGVTTYETTAVFKLPDDQRFDLLVVDEAHYIKNKKAKRTKNVIKLSQHTDRIMFMTGTALENRVDEMISLVSDLQPGTARRLQSMAFMSTAPQFRDAAAPVYYRRKRDDVLNELPELIENEEWCTLTPQEEEVYERSVLSKNYAASRRVSWNVGDLNYSSKARRLMEIIDDAEDDERKVIVFSFFLDTIRGISQLLGPKCYGPINGSVPPERRQQIIDEFHDAPDGSVLVAQIQSGGTGLNIQDASVVVICEPQLKPSIENQAISRAHRMGQARNVLVHRLLCEDTIDERITDMLAQKQAIFDAFADKSSAAEETIEIDNKSIGTIIQEEIDRINEKNGIINGKETVDSKDIDEASEQGRYPTSKPINVPEPKTDTGNSDEIYSDPADTTYPRRNEKTHNHASASTMKFSNYVVSEAPSANISNVQKQKPENRNPADTVINEKASSGRNVAASNEQTQIPLAEYLRKRKFNIVDNQNSSGILWVVFNSREDYVLYKGNLERIFNEYGVSYAYESRGAMATNGKPAYRVMMRR